MVAGMLVGEYVADFVESHAGALQFSPGLAREFVGRERAAQAIYDAVRLRIEGRFGQALKQATAAYEAGESRGLAALLAARAAHSLRDETRYRYWLGKAAEHDGETRVARLMTEAKLAVEERRFDEAAERIADLQAGGQRQDELRLQHEDIGGEMRRGAAMAARAAEGDGPAVAVADPAVAQRAQAAVVLPLPDGPTSATHSPGCAEKLTPLST